MRGHSASTVYTCTLMTVYNTHRYKVDNSNSIHSPKISVQIFRVYIRLYHIQGTACLCLQPHKHITQSEIKLTT